MPGALHEHSKLKRRSAMIHITDDHAIRAMPGDVLGKFGRLRARIAAALEAGGRSFHKVEAAHITRCERASFAAEEYLDTGIDPSDATGIASWQPELPFFMQGGCARE
jgi:hypothetical protein